MKNKTQKSKKEHPEILNLLLRNDNQVNVVKKPKKKSFYMKSKKSMLIEAKKLIDWFWKESAGRVQEAEFCQCGAEDIIAASSNPELMRSFLFIGTVIDQTMNCNQDDYYKTFRDEFKYPIVICHPCGGRCVGPSWFVNNQYSNKEEINWDNAAEVGQLLLGALFYWLRPRSALGKAGIQKFKDEVHKKYSYRDEDPRNSYVQKLLSIVESVK
jgi:hypothetical protein